MNEVVPFCSTSSKECSIDKSRIPSLSIQDIKSIGVDIGKWRFLATSSSASKMKYFLRVKTIPLTTLFRDLRNKK